MITRDGINIENGGIRVDWFDGVENLAASLSWPIGIPCLKRNQKNFNSGLIWTLNWQIYFVSNGFNW